LRFLLAILPFTTATQTTSTLDSISIPQPQQKIEADLIFPTNTTYNSLAYFPLIIGLTNTHVTWPLHTVLWIILEPLDAETQNRSHTGKWEEWEPFPFPVDGGLNFTIGAPPSDPFIYHVFPEMLREYSKGRWRLVWEFGFLQSCWEGSERVDDHFWEWGVMREVFFTIADNDDDDNGDSSAHDVDDVLRSWDCASLERTPGKETDSELSAAFEVLGWKTLKPEDNEPFPHYTYCPIFRNNMNAGLGATIPEPCKLVFGSSDIEAIVADARSISGCDGRTLSEMEWDCYGRDERMRRKWRWGIGVMVFVLGVYTVIAVGREWRVGRRG
jgi:hypothetical protein